MAAIDTLNAAVAALQAEQATIVAALSAKPVDNDPAISTAAQNINAFVAAVQAAAAPAPTTPAASPATAAPAASTAPTAPSGAPVAAPAEAAH